MESTIAPFVRRAVDVNYTVLNIFNEKLGLPQGTLERLHTIEEHSGSEARCIRNPPPQVKEAADKLAIGAHTDFGSLVGYQWRHVSGVVFISIFSEFLAQSAWWTPGDASWP
jgi:isopenicillin N synthase-like dioxygenase